MRNPRIREQFLVNLFICGIKDSLQSNIIPKSEHIDDIESVDLVVVLDNITLSRKENQFKFCSV